MDATERPRLVFIHGTAGFRHPRKWLDPLNKRLEDRGIAPWRNPEVLAVRYKKVLREAQDPTTQTRSVLPSEQLATSEAEYERNRFELSEILADRGTQRKARGQEVPDSVSERGSRIVRATKFWKTAKRYPARRQRVRQKVLRELDGLGPGDLILIGYSLGSVVAADLLAWLRPDQHVRLLVTIGSPLSAGAWNPTVRSLKSEFPYVKLDAWVNIYNRRDWVTGRRGLESRVRQVIDVRIGRFPKKPKKPMFDQHNLGRYARHAALADAIEWATSGTHATTGTEPVEAKFSTEVSA